MLKNIRMPNEPIPEVAYGSDSPTVKCENCPKKGPSHLMINVMVCIGSPGHPSLPAFQCSAVEHWACTPECWVKVAHACIDEHMLALLSHHRNTIVKVVKGG